MPSPPCLLQEAFPRGPDEDAETRSESLSVAVCRPRRSGRPSPACWPTAAPCLPVRRRPSPHREQPRTSAGAAAPPEGGAARHDTSADGRNLRLFHGPSLLALTETTLAALSARAETDALNPYLTLGDLRRDLARGKESPALDAALERLVAGRRVRGPSTATAGREAAGEPDAAQSEAVTRPAGTVRRAGRSCRRRTGCGRPTARLRQLPQRGCRLRAPSVAAAAEAAGLAPREAQKIVDALVRQGTAGQGRRRPLLPAGPAAGLMDRLAAAMEAAGQLTLAEARDLLGTSRRYAQALLEHMDSEGLTLRVGEARRLRRRRR